VAGTAGIAGHPAAVGAARDRGRIGVHVVALGWDGRSRDGSSCSADS
jgi:hypothetical protein